MAWRLALALRHTDTGPRTWRTPGPISVSSSGKDATSTHTAAVMTRHDRMRQDASTPHTRIHGQRCNQHMCREGGGGRLQRRGHSTASVPDDVPSNAANSPAVVSKKTPLHARLAAVSRPPDTAHACHARRVAAHAGIDTMQAALTRRTRSTAAQVARRWKLGMRGTMLPAHCRTHVEYST